MGTTGRDGDDRRVGEFAIALLCIGAFSLIAIAIASTGGALGTIEVADSNDTDDGPTAVDRPNVIGSGSLGEAERNPVGVPIGDGPNPFVAESDERQFVVIGDRPAYWRVDAYSDYEEGAWLRTGESSSFDERQPLGTPTDTGTYYVSLDGDAVALPAAWEPASVRNTDDSTVLIGAEHGLHPATRLPAGSTYTLESYQYDITPAELQNAWGEYPISVKRQYTHVPESVPERVETRSGEITADAETPYETVLAVTDWIEANREYDRSATHADGDPVDAFLFEMEAGNAEYMASSTAMMLRSEGVPARYVTGYAPGEATPNTDDRYAVRGVNGHAWTEVYFAGHGWVPIDPTPAGQRVATEIDVSNPDGEMIERTPTMEALLNPSELPDGPTPPDLDDPDADGLDDIDGSTGDDDSDEQGSVDDGETDGGSNDGTDDQDTDESDDESDDQDTGDESDDESDEQDTDNETEPVQEADDGVTVELSTVPPQPGTEVTVTVRDEGEPVRDAIVRFDGEAVGTTDDDGQVVATVPYRETLVVEVTPAVSEQSSTVTFPVATDVTIAADPVPLVSGGEATVQAQVGGTSLPDADLYLDGDQIGATDDAGEATITVPDDPDAQEYTITVRRGEIDGERTVSAGELALTSESETVLALPGQELTLTATVGDTPVSGVEIRDGETVIATTDSGGQASVTASYSRTTTVTGWYAGQETTTTIENRLVPVTLGATLLVGGLGAIGLVLRRRSDRLVSIRRRVALRARQGIDAVVGTILWLEDVLAGVPAMLRDAGISALWRLARLPGLAIATLWRQGPSALLAGLFAVRGWITGYFRSRTSDSTQSGPVSESGSDAGSPSDEQREASMETIRQAWAEFVGLVLRRIDPTWTPGDVARRAIALGFPQKPVHRLTDTVRLVEFGRGRPDDGLDEATDALTEIEASNSERDVDHGDTIDSERVADD